MKHIFCAVFAVLLPVPALACGIQLVTAETPQNIQATLDADSGKPVIMINPLLPVQVGGAGMRFAIARECAHHQLGHVKVEPAQLKADPYAKPWLMSARELAADCEAARNLAERFDSRALEAAIQAMNNNALAPSGLGYPSGERRAAEIRRCAGMAS